MSHHPKYKIKCLRDMFDIPRDRREDFIKDFLLWYAEAEKLNSVLSSEYTALESFTWVDDGKPGLSAINVEY